MEDDGSNSIRRMSSRTRKVASKMAAALASADNRTQAALARLDALENDNSGFEIADANNDDDDDASLDEEDQCSRKAPKGRQAKALEARRAPRTFLELLHEANLESLPPHVPSYWKAVVGPPSSNSRCHFCTICGFSANYTCVRCAEAREATRTSRPSKNQEQHNLPGWWKVFLVVLVMFTAFFWAVGDSF